MARNIAADHDRAFRAVIQYQDPTSLITEIEGVYNKVGTAKARVSWWRNHLGPERLMDGWVEEAEITWKRLD